MAFPHREEVRRGGAKRKRESTSWRPIRERILQSERGDSLCFGPAKEERDLHRRRGGVQGAVLHGDRPAGVVPGDFTGLDKLLWKGARDEVKTNRGPRFGF